MGENWEVEGGHCDHPLRHYYLLEPWDKYQRDAMRLAEQSIGKGTAVYLDKLRFGRLVSSHTRVYK